MTVLGKRVEISLDNILFATDFSADSERAGVYVKALARRYGSRVQLVHVIDLSSAYQTPDAGICIDRLTRVGEEGLKKTRAQFEQEATVESTLCEEMDPATKIVQIAKEKLVDLVVIGTRGQNGLDRLVSGSMDEQLIHRVSCPVLTVGPNVKPPGPGGLFQRVVYATDFSPEAAKAATFALSFAQDSGAHIYLCHVLSESGHPRVDDAELTEKYSAALRRMIPDISREWCEPECVLEEGYAADGILLLAHRVAADLIILGTRRFSHWFDSVKAGVAYEVIRAVECPVLTVCGESK